MREFWTDVWYGMRNPGAVLREPESWKAWKPW